MAYSFIKNKKGGVGVLLDSAADISLVPVDQFFPGTFAFTADGSARYRLSTSRSWVEVAGGGVTPGGGWPEDLPLPSEGGYGYSEEPKTVVVEWDGDPTGKETVVMPGGSLVRVSDEIPKSLLGATAYGMCDEEEASEPFEITVIDQDVTIDEEWGYIVSAGFSIVVIYADNTTVSGLTPMPLVFEHSGIYFSQDEHVASYGLSFYSDGIHKIDPKYLDISRLNTPRLVKVNRSYSYEQIIELIDSGFTPYVTLGNDYRQTVCMLSRDRRTGSDNPHVMFTGSAAFSDSADDETYISYVRVYTAVVAKYGGWAPTTSVSILDNGGVLTIDFFRVDDGIYQTTTRTIEDTYAAYHNYDYMVTARIDDAEFRLVHCSESNGTPVLQFNSIDVGNTGTCTIRQLTWTGTGYTATAQLQAFEFAATPLLSE